MTKVFVHQVCLRERSNSFLIIPDLVVDKCCGLPIVIFAVAKYLSRLSDDQVTQFITAAVEDGKFIHELATNPQPEFVRLKGLLAWVDSCLKSCPQSLKLLILYMLNFSKETVIRRKRLVWRWIAEGYIKNTGICDMVTEAEKRVRELEDLTMMMMQVPPCRSPYTWHRGYQLSGFSGDVLMSRAAEDPLFLPLEVSALTEGKRSLTSRGCAGRHLRVDDKWERSEFVFRSLDLSRLRSLTVSGEFKAFFLNDSMKVLRVLDLEDATWVYSSDLEEIPKLLPRLRFLSLRRSSGIDRLPDSIGDLRQLQTLDIRRTRITTLPDSILKLRNLQCLRAGYTMKAWTMGYSYTPWRRRISSRLRGLVSCPWHTQTLSDYGSQGVTMPRGMSQLTALHTLGIVNVNTAGGEAILEELGDLKQLRKVELYGINSSNVRGLRHLPHSLDYLSLEFTKDWDTTSSSIDTMCKAVCFLWEDMERRSFRLKLHAHVGIVELLPDDIMVTDLTLEIDTSTTEGNMKRIGKLPMVRTLRLHFHTHQAGGKLKFDANGDFPQLRVLEITSLSFPLDVEFAPGALKSLVVLKCVGSLQIPPGGLHFLPSLEEVWIKGRSLEEAMGDSEILEGHPNKPAVIDYSSWRYLRDPENRDPLQID